MRNINLCWKIMNDPSEPRNYRIDAEAEVREFAWVGMLPDEAPRDTFVLAQCAKVRTELGVEIGPQPVRLDVDELYLLISAIEAVSVGNENSGEFDSVMNKLRHKTKSLRNAKNRERKEIQNGRGHKESRKGEVQGGGRQEDRQVV